MEKILLKSDFCVAMDVYIFLLDKFLGQNISLSSEEKPKDKRIARIGHNF